MDKIRLIAYLKVFFTVFVWGASFIATKVSLQEVSPITVVWLRFAIGVFILGVIVLYRRQLTFPQHKDWAYFALLGFLGIAFHQWLQSNALLTSLASTTAWIITTTPVFMAFLGWLFLKEKLGWVRIGGIILAGLGVLVVVSRGDLTSLSLRNFGEPGDILVLISSLNWAIFSVLSRPSLQRHSAEMMTFYVMTLGWLFISFMFISERGYIEIGNLTRNGWISIGFLGVFCSGLAYIFWYDGLKVIPASQVGAFLYFEPLVAVGVAAIVLSEVILTASLFGGAAILVGVWLVNQPVSKTR